MNKYDAIAVVCDHLDIGDDDSLREARSACRALVDAWERMLPDWSASPAWATHCMFDPETSIMKWSEGKPDILGSGWSYRNVLETLSFRRIALHPGIDWRECVWERPSSKGGG